MRRQDWLADLDKGTSRRQGCQGCRRGYRAVGVFGRVLTLRLWSHSHPGIGITLWGPLCLQPLASRLLRIFQPFLFLLLFLRLFFHLRLNQPEGP